MIDADKKGTTPEKIEFNSNVQTLKYLKKELFKVKFVLKS